MKKILVFMVVLLSFTLIGCTPGLNITITPTTMEFNSGDDLIEGQIEATITGVGALTIDAVTVQVIEEVEEGDPLVLLSFNSADEDMGDILPYTVPFAFQGLEHSFDLQDDLFANSEFAGLTVNALLENVPDEYSEMTYDDLVGKTFKFKVTITGTATSTAQASLVFN